MALKSWSFSRKIITGFGILATMAVAILITSLISLRSVMRARNIEKVASEDETMTSELYLAHEAEVSAARAVLLSPTAHDRFQMKKAHTDFNGRLEAFVVRIPNGDIHDLLLKIYATEQAYSSALNRSITMERRSNWVLENIAKPLRTQLEGDLTTLNGFIRSRTDALRQAQANGARIVLRNIIALAAATILLLIGIGRLIFKTLQTERESLNRLFASERNFRAGELRAELLASTGKLLSEGEPPEETLKIVAGLAVKWLSNLCLIELKGEEDHALKSVALALSKTGRDVLLDSLYLTLPLGLGSLFGTSTILNSGVSAIKESVIDERLKGLGINSYVVILLRARGRMLGTLLLARVEGQTTYGKEDLRFCQELGLQMALAIDNSRLLRRAEAGLKMREELLATVAHDLKNPLTSIRLNSEVLAKEIDSGKLDPKVQLKKISSSSQQMERLIYDLLDLTKIESGGIALEKKPYDVDELIGAAFTVFSDQASKKPVELVKETKPGEIFVECDRSRFMQIISNLLGNAIKFTDQGGRVRVEAQTTGEGIRFCVIDNGPGISAEQLPHVFDRYWQADRNRISGTGTGTGLGLSIARGLVEAHAGRIWAESALHFGSRFFFTLPEARKQLGKGEKAA